MENEFKEVDGRRRGGWTKGKVPLKQKEGLN
jgi:hypothetical protein